MKKQVKMSKKSEPSPKAAVKKQAPKPKKDTTPKPSKEINQFSPELEGIIKLNEKIDQLTQSNKAKDAMIDVYKEENTVLKADFTMCEEKLKAHKEMTEMIQSALRQAHHNIEVLNNQIDELNVEILELKKEIELNHKQHEDVVSILEHRLEKYEEMGLWDRVFNWS